MNWCSVSIRVQQGGCGTLGRAGKEEREQTAPQGRTGGVWVPLKLLHTPSIAPGPGQLAVRSAGAGIQQARRRKQSPTPKKKPEAVIESALESCWGI